MINTCRYTSIHFNHTYDISKQNERCYLLCLIPLNTQAKLEESGYEKTWVSLELGLFYTTMQTSFAALFSCLSASVHLRILLWSTSHKVPS